MLMLVNTGVELAVLFLNEAMLIYALALLAVLALIYLLCIFNAREKDWKITRLSLRTCKNCGRVFIVGRRMSMRTVPCPSCGHANSENVREEYGDAFCESDGGVYGGKRS